MITAKAFSRVPFDWDKNGNPYYVAKISKQSFGLIGSEYHSYFATTSVLWLSTIDNRRPRDSWLDCHFPMLEELTEGFRIAFKQYREVGCGDEMYRVMMQKLSADHRIVFERDNWLPFISVQEIRINADASVVAFGCSAVPEEYNLFEHGISIVSCQGKWSFGYYGDDAHYFQNWNGPLPKHQLRFRWQRFWKRWFGTPSLADGNVVVESCD